MPVQTMPNNPDTLFFTLEEVAEHNSEGNAWVVIGENVYDVSKFASFHPGGRFVLMQHAGKDASAYFDQVIAPRFYF